MAGRKSTFREEYIQQAENYALLGATDAQMAALFGVSVPTLNKWKRDYPLFLSSLKRGKDIADATVVAKLYSRAIGYDYEEKQTVKRGTRVISEKTISKHQPPDTTAQIFWLKNRKPEAWKDKQDINVNNDEWVDALKSLTNSYKNGEKGGKTEADK